MRWGIGLYGRVGVCVCGVALIKFTGGSDLRLVVAARDCFYFLSCTFQPRSESPYLQFSSDFGTPFWFFWHHFGAPFSIMKYVVISYRLGDGLWYHV